MLFLRYTLLYCSILLNNGECCRKKYFFPLFRDVHSYGAILGLQTKNANEGVILYLTTIFEISECIYYVLQGDLQLLGVKSLANTIVEDWEKNVLK